MLVRVRRAWESVAPCETSESAYYSRRRFIGMAAGAGLAAVGMGDSSTWTSEEPAHAKEDDSVRDVDAPAKQKTRQLYPAPRNEKFKLDRAMTLEGIATAYNNFYEFSFGKTAVAALAQKKVTTPWSVEVAGLVAKPRRFDVSDLVRRIELEERLYRFRCVETWAMAVPWTGFPLAKLLKLVEPLGSAKFVRFVTFHNPEWGDGFKDDTYPWPYFEALTIEEAMNEMTLLATGLYGKPLPKQNGAPVRLVVPWKYGFKSIKSIVRVELTEKQPPTFWSQVVPHEYKFEANVDPAVPHPRWSQARERMIGTNEVRPTLPYNGYSEQVAHLYKK